MRLKFIAYPGMEDYAFKLMVTRQAGILALRLTVLYKTFYILFTYRKPTEAETSEISQSISSALDQLSGRVSGQESPELASKISELRQSIQELKQGKP
jgi:hypothetical protein